MWTTREKRHLTPVWAVGAFVLLAILSASLVSFTGTTTASPSSSSHATPDSCTYPATQYSDAETGSAGPAVDGPFSMTAGDTLVVVGIAYGGTSPVLSVSDTVNVYTAGIAPATSGLRTVEAWSATASTSQSLSITVSATGSPSYVAAIAWDANSGVPTFGNVGFGNALASSSVSNAACSLVYAADSSFGSASSIASWMQDQQTTSPVLATAWETTVASAGTTTASDSFTAAGGPYSSVLTVALGAPTAPNAPTGVTAATEPLDPPHNYGDNLIDLTWTNPAGTLTDNHIYVYEQDCMTLITSYDEIAVVTGATIGSLTPGTTYCFTVTASNSVGEGAQSVGTTASLNTTLATAPTMLTLGTVTTTSIQFTWTIAPGNVTGNEVTLYAGGSCAGAPLDQEALGNVTTATAATLTPSTTYSFTLNATTAGGTGPGSACLAGTTTSLPPPPPPPPAGVGAVVEAAVLGAIALLILLTVLGAKGMRRD
jgi:hypothetical protein